MSGSVNYVLATMMLVVASSITNMFDVDYSQMHCSFRPLTQLLISKTLLVLPTLYFDVSDA